MKRMRLLPALCAALALTATTASAEDVTSKYLHNPGFELCEALTASTDGVENDYEGTDSDGNTWTWNHTHSGEYFAGGVLAYGSSYYVGNSSYTVPSTNWEENSDNKNALGVQARWKANYSYYDSEEMTLPAGVYAISVHYYNSNTNSGSTTVTSYVGFVATSGTTYYTSNTTFTAGSWQTASVTFTLTEETAGTVRLGYYHPNNTSSGDSPELFFDDVTIEYTDPSTSADITDDLLANADFSEGTLVTEGTTTYDYDMSSNGVEMYGLQAVSGWTANEPSDNTVGSTTRDENARAGGLFAYGSGAWLGSSSYAAPSAGPDGSTEGNALGLVTVWSSTSIYASDTITLPAGYYTVTIPVYNSAGTGSITNYTGFVSTDGTTSYASSTTYTVGEWTTETIEFLLSEATEGQFQFGFSSSNGSGSSPHLFYDGVTVESTAEAGVGVVSIDYEYDSDTNALGTATVTFRAWCTEDETSAKALADELAITLSDGTNAAVSYTLTASEEEDGVYTADLSAASLSYSTEYTLTVAADQYGFSEDLANQDGEASFTTRDESLTLTIGSSGWTSTYYGDYNLTIPDDVTAYTVEVQDSEDDSEVTALATAITGSVIPKGTPVLLAGDANDYTFTIATSATELSATNDLKGSDAAKVIASSDEENYYYKFSLDSNDSDGSIGFYWYASDGHSYTATAHKAYLVIEAGEEDSEVKTVTFVVNDGQATAISSVNTEEAQAAKGIYTLTGIRLGTDTETLPAGLYIINGKKTLIK